MADKCQQCDKGFKLKGMNNCVNNVVEVEKFDRVYVAIAAILGRLLIGTFVVSIVILLNQK